MSRVFPVETCTKCGDEPRRRGQRWGLKCHARWMRENRPTYAELTPEQKRKANARSRLNREVSRGAISKPRRCERCDKAREVEAHHRDYSKPLDVEWLCADCHQDEHATVKKQPRNRRARARHHHGTSTTGGR